MAPHPNLFIIYWSTSVPKLVLLSKSAQLVSLSAALYRLRVSHTRFTHVHLLTGEDLPACQSCFLPLTVITYLRTVLTWTLADTTQILQSLLT